MSLGNPDSLFDPCTQGELFGSSSHLKLQVTIAQEGKPSDELVLAIGKP